MIGNYKTPKPNTMIIVWKWNREEGSKDYDEINSNQFNPACYDGWKYINNKEENGKN